MDRFFTSQEAQREARAHLDSATNLPTDVLEQLLLAEAIVTQPEDGLGSRAIYGRWIVRRNQLRDFGCFLALLTIGTKLAAGLIHAQSDPLKATEAVVGTLQGLYDLYCKVVAKGFVLDRDHQLQVILALRALSLANSADIGGRLQMSPERVESILSELQFTPGRPTGVVVREADGRWRLDGV